MNVTNTLDGTLSVTIACPSLPSPEEFAVLTRTITENQMNETIQL